MQELFTFLEMFRFYLQRNYIIFSSNLYNVHWNYETALQPVLIISSYTSADYIQKLNDYTCVACYFMSMLYITMLYKTNYVEYWGFVSNEDRFVHRGCWLLSCEFRFCSHKDHELASDHGCSHQSNNNAMKHKVKVHENANPFYMEPHHYKLSPRSLCFDSLAIHVSVWLYFPYVVDKLSNRLCWIWPWNPFQCPSRHSSQQPQVMTHWVEGWLRLERWRCWQASLDGVWRYCLLR